MKIYQPKDYKGNKLVSEELLASKNYATRDEFDLKADQAYVDGELTKKADTAALEAHTSNDGIHVTLDLKDKIDGQYSKEETDALIASKAEQEQVDELVSKVEGKVEQTDFDELSDKVDTALEDITSLQGEVEQFPDIAQGIADLTESKADKTELEQAQKDLLAEIENRTESMFHYRGSVEIFEELEPKQAEAKKGDVWNVSQTDANYVWTGENWDKLNERHDGLTNKKDFDNHVNNTDIHVGEGERERWDDKYTKEEAKAELDKKADVETVEILQSTVTNLTERTETLESTSNTTTEALGTLVSKTELEEYKTEAEEKFVSKEEVTETTGKVTELESNISELQTQVTGLETSKANQTDLTALTNRVTKHEQEALKAETTFKYIPLVSTDCDETESDTCTSFTLANHLLTSGTISTLTLTNATESNAYCTLFVSSNGTTWIKLASSNNVENGTWTFDNAILPADLHLRCTFTAAEIADGNSEGDQSITIKKSNAENTDKISSYHNNTDNSGIVCVTITFNEETTESVKDHITDQTKHLTENEKHNLQTLFSGYNGSTTLDDIEKKLSSAATDANLEALTRQVQQKADQSALNTLESKVNKKAEQSALDALTATVEGKASSADLVQVQSDLQNKADQSELTKVQESLASKASTSALESAKADLQRQLDTKAESSAVELLQSKIETLESATIEETIIGHETSKNAASAKAVADYVTGVKTELTTALDSKVDNTEFQGVSTQVTENKGKLDQLEETIATLAGGSEVTTLQKKVDALEQNKADNTKLTEVQTTLQGKIDANKTSIDAINEQISSMTNSIDEHFTTLDEQVEANTSALADKVGQTEYQAKVTDIEGQIKGKVSTEEFTTELGKKANKDYVDAQLEGKANTTDLQEVQDELQSKATVSSVTELSGRVSSLEDSSEDFSTRLQSLEAKEDPVVDQEYKATSQNAQSGKAVAEGIAEAIKPLATTDALTEGLAEKASNETVTQLETKVTTVETNLSNHTKDETIHVKSEDKTRWDAKVEQAALTDLETKLNQTIESKVGSVFHWKGTKETLELLLAVDDAQIGDVWNVTENGGANYVYSGENLETETKGWDKLSEDLTGYATSTQLTEHTTNTNLHVQDNDRTKWDGKADQSDITSAVNAAKTELEGALEKKADITYVEQLTAGLPTDTKVEELSKKIESKLDTATYTQEKENFATKTDLEDKVTNESLTAQLANYVTSTDLSDHEENTDIHVTKEKQAGWDQKLDTNDLSLALEGQKSEFTSLLEQKASQQDLTTHTNNKEIHLEEGDKEKWDAKLDESVFTEYQQTITSQLATKAEAGAYDEKIAKLTKQVESKAEEVTVTSLSTKVTELESKIPKVDNVYEGTSENAQSGKAVFNALEAFKETIDGDIEDKLGDYATTEALNQQSTTLNANIEAAKTAASTALSDHASNTTLHPSEEQQELWNAKVDTAQLDKAINDAISANNVNITSQLNNKVDNEKFNKHETDETIHVTQAEKNKLADIITEAEVNVKLKNYTLTTVLNEQLAQKVNTTEFTKQLANKVDTATFESELEGKADSNALQEHIDAEDLHVSKVEKTGWNNKVETSALNAAISGLQTTLSAQIDLKANTADLTKHTGNTAIHVGDGEKAKWNAKADTTWVTTQISNATDSFTEQLGAKADSEDLTALETQLASKAESSAVETLSGTVTTLDKTVKDMKASIDALEAGTVQIDDKYDSTSGHAISGKGVADALSSYATSASVSTLETQVSGFQTKLDDKAEVSKVTELEGQLATKLDESALTEKLADYVQTSDLDDITQQLADKASATDLSGHITDTTIHFTKDEKKNLQAQVTNVETQLKGKADSSALTDLQDQIDQALTEEEAASLYAKLTDFTELQTTVAGKAEDSGLKALTALVQEKADQAEVDAKFEGYTTTEDLNTKLDKKADKDALTKLETTVNGKLDASALEGYVQTTDLEEQLATKANSSDITSLREDLDDKVDNATLIQTLGSYVQSTELTKQLATKADKSELSKYALQETVTALDTEVDTNTQAIVGLTEELTQKIDDSALTEKLEFYVLQTIFDSHTKNENKGVLHVTEQDKTSWNSKVDEELLQSTVKTGDNTVKEALTKEITRVENKIPQVDQTYIDEETFGQSVNAQSGKSVQTALTKLEAKLLEEISGGDISLDGYATTQDLTTQKIELEGKITKAQTAAENAQTAADSATTAAAGAQTKAETAQSNLDEHEQDSTKHITAVERQKWNDKIDDSRLQTAISDAKTQITEQYQAAIKSAVGTVFKWKGTVDELTDLDDLKETAEVGDVYNVTNEGGANYVWSGPESEEDDTGGWDKLSENLEGFATAEVLETHTSNDSLHFKGNEKNDWNTQIQANKTGLASVTSQVTGINGQIEELQLKDQQIEADLKTKANSSDLTKYALDADLDELTEQVSTKATSAELAAHTGNTNIHFTGKIEKDGWKSDIDTTKSGLTTLQGTVTTHTGDNTLHFELDEKEAWESDISGAKTDISSLKTKTDTINTELLGLKGTVEGEQKKLKEHIADVTVAHFNEGEKDSMQSSISALETQIATKVDQAAINKAVASKAESTRVEEIGSDLQDLIDGIDHTWQSPESALSEGLQTGVAVAGAVKEHEDKADIHVTKVFKDSLATKEYVDSKTTGLATSGNIESLTNDVKQAQTDLTTHTENTNIHFENEEEKTEWSGKLTSHESSISTLSTELQDTKGKYETLDATVKGIQSDLDDKADATALAGKADTSVTDGLSTRIDGIEKKIPEVEKTYNGETFAESAKVPTGEVVSDAIDAALMSYVTTESVTGQISSAIEAAKTAVKADLQASIDEKADNSALQDHIGDENAHFTSTEKSTLTKKVDDTATNLTTVTGQVTSALNEIEELQTQDDTLEASIASNTGEIATLKSSVGTNTANITTLQAEVKKLQGKDVTVDSEWGEESAESANAQSGVAVAGAIAEHKQEAGLHTTTAKQSQWDQNTTDIASLRTAVGNCALKSQLGEYVTTEKFSTLETKVNGYDTTLSDLQDTVATKIDNTALDDYTTTAELTEMLTNKVDNDEFTQLSDKLTQYETIAGATAKYATKDELGNLDTKVGTKASKTELEALTEQVESKIDQDGLDTAIGTAKSEIKQEYQEAINTAVGSVFTWKGNIDSLELLKEVKSPKTGDVYNVTNEGGANYVYSGDTETGESGWDKLSENLSGLASKSDLDGHKADSEVHFTNGQKTTMQNDISTAKTNISSLENRVGTLESDVDGIKSDYLEKTEAGTTYLKITEAESTYLTITEANSTYLESAEAAMEYVTKTSFNELQTRVNTNTTNYESLQKTVETLQTRLQALESTAVTSTTTKKIEVYTNPADAPELGQREEGTLYLVGDGEQ